MHPWWILTGKVKSMPQQWEKVNPGSVHMTIKGVMYISWGNSLLFHRAGCAAGWSQGEVVRPRGATRVREAPLRVQAQRGFADCPGSAQPGARSVQPWGGTWRAQGVHVCREWAAAQVTAAFRPEEKPSPEDSNWTQGHRQGQSSFH